MRVPTRFAIAAFVGWLSALVSPAADPPKPNTLTEQEIADGWISLFDGETLFGSYTPDEHRGRVAVADNAIVLKSDRDAGSIDFRPLPLAYEMVCEWETTGTVIVSPWFQQHENQYTVTPARKASGFRMVCGGIRSDLRLRVGDEYLTTPEKFSAQACGVGSPSVSFEVSRGTLRIKALKLRPIDLKPLFNNKDLSGWKVFDADPKNAKAKFEVTPAGELYVTGGPGDLQTTGKYADFVLQARAKTNRPLVNSGIFFRCIEGQYQNGYECQIQNAVVNNDRTKPVDAGTGAIYRRVPARKVVSTDGEWFTLTVIANGPHLSTWVNGYQTVDWTDDRKPDPNPRKGLRTEAGHVSIQGHGPPTTADVLFQSVKIAELKPAK